MEWISSVSKGKKGCSCEMHDKRTNFKTERTCVFSSTPDSPNFSCGLQYSTKLGVTELFRYFTNRIRS